MLVVVLDCRVIFGSVCAVLFQGFEWGRRVRFFFLVALVVCLWSD